MKSYLIKSKVRGFTLIEFLVASALAVIVVTAAFSTYFTTRQLNVSAQTRIDAQNNLRNAATMIARDARVAGSFGCMTTGGVAKTADSTESVGKTKVFPDISAVFKDKIILTSDNASGYGVSWLDATQVGLPAGITFNSDVLVFVYGKGNVAVSQFSSSSLMLINVNDSNITDALSKKAPMVLSSCQNAYTIIPSSSNGNSVNYSAVPAIDTGIPQADIGAVSVSQLYAAAYVIGEVNGRQSLLRYDLGNNGAWQDPQLLATDVTDMKVSFAYQQECDDTNKTPSFTFAYSDKLSRQNLPALVQIELTTDNDSVSDKYVINASVRGGTQCATISKL